MDWPEEEEALSDSAVDCVERLLCMDPSTRAKSSCLKAHSFFAGLGVGDDWSKLLDVAPPWVPTLDGEADTTYFEPRNNLQHLKLSEIDLHRL